MRRIIVLNQKGGVGKTTTVANLGACLAEAGRTVLLVDVDPQAHLSIHYGHEVGRDEPSLYSLLHGEHELAEVVRRTEVEGLGIVPSNIDLSGLPVELADAPGRLFVLRRALEQVPEGFDYLIMDSPPSLGLLTVNAICAAREVFIPLQCEFFALQGLSKLLETVERVRSSVNPELEITGVLAVMHDPRTRLSQEILDDLKGHFGPRVFRTRVRKNVRLAEAPGFGRPIVTYDPACHGAEDYRALAAEVLAMEDRATAETEAAADADGPAADAVGGEIETAAVAMTEAAARRDVEEDTDAGTGDETADESAHFTGEDAAADETSAEEATEMGGADVRAHIGPNAPEPGRTGTNAPEPGRIETNTPERAHTGPDGPAADAAQTTAGTAAPEPPAGGVDIGDYSREVPREFMADSPVSPIVFKERDAVGPPREAAGAGPPEGSEGTRAGRDADVNEAESYPGDQPYVA